MQPASNQDGETGRLSTQDKKDAKIIKSWKPRSRRLFGRRDRRHSAPSFCETRREDGLLVPGVPCSPLPLMHTASERCYARAAVCKLDTDNSSMILFCYHQYDSKLLVFSSIECQCDAYLDDINVTRYPKSN